jgi:predicted transposase/invertase (TIGR01784 family)
MNKKENIPEILPPKVDVVFKMLFGEEKNKRFLIEFLKAVLTREIQDISLIDTAIKPKYQSDKMSVVDVKAQLSDGQRVDIEIQVKNTREMRSRVTYYSAGMIVEQLGKGEKYLGVKPVISIIISEKTMITESRKCHNIFSMLEVEEHFLFNDLQEIHILDLSRVDRESNKPLANWLRFINSDREEEFMAVSQRDETIRSAFGELKEISADKQRRMVYEARLKAQRDRWMFEDDARADGIERGMAKGMAKGRVEGRAEGMAKAAKNLKNLGIPLAQISQATGLSMQEIEDL